MRTYHDADYTPSRMEGDIVSLILLFPIPFLSIHLSGCHSFLSRSRGGNSSPPLSCLDGELLCDVCQGLVCAADVADHGLEAG
jgi:hypothetical protein